MWTTTGENNLDVSTCVNFQHVRPRSKIRKALSVVKRDALERSMLRDENYRFLSNVQAVESAEQLAAQGQLEVEEFFDDKNSLQLELKLASVFIADSGTVALSAYQRESLFGVQCICKGRPRVTLSVYIHVSC